MSADNFKCCGNCKSSSGTEDELVCSKKDMKVSVNSVCGKWAKECFNSCGNCDNIVNLGMGDFGCMADKSKQKIPSLSNVCSDWKPLENISSDIYMTE